MATALGETNMRERTTAAGMAAILTALFTGNIEPQPLPKDAKPKVIIVGRGVAGDQRTVRPQDFSNREVPGGPAMAAGFASLLSDEAALRGFEFEWWDDNDDPQRAVALAARFAADPAVVAVIGHTSSTCTAAAYPVYRAAGIPIVLPVSTSVLIGSNDDGVAESGITRVIASDALQASAVASALRLLKCSRCLLVYEDDPAIRDYVLPLKYMIEQTAGNLLVKMPVSAATWAPDRIADEVLAQDVNVVCFLGYPDMARRIRHSLHPQRLTRVFGGSHPPVSLLLPDSCVQMLAGTESAGVPTYILFPLDASEKSPPSTTPPAGSAMETDFEPAQWNSVVNALFGGSKPQSLRLGYERTGLTAARALLQCVNASDANASDARPAMTRKSLREGLRPPKDATTKYYLLQPGAPVQELVFDPDKSHKARLEAIDYLRKHMTTETTR